MLIVERWLPARIRNETFHTLRVLSTRLQDLLTNMNNQPMQGYRNQTRAERFRIPEAPAFSPLPLAAYEYTERDSDSDQLFTENKRFPHVIIRSRHHHIRYNKINWRGCQKIPHLATICNFCGAQTVLPEITGNQITNLTIVIYN